MVSNLPALISTAAPPPPPPPLVWSNGRPMMLDIEQLQIDVAGPRLGSTRSINSGHPSVGLTPARLAQLLIGAEQGDATAFLELAEEIEEKEWQYASVLGTRKRAVSQLPISVEAAGEDEQSQEDAAFLRKWLQRDTLQMELFDILDAVGKGFSVTEIVWKRTSTEWLPERLEWRDPRWFRFDPVDGRTLQLLTDDGPQPLSPFKYIQHIHPQKSGLPIRGGLARPAAWAWMFKNFTMKEWLAFIEVFGMPLRVGRYNNGESEENIRKLMSAIAQIGSDAAAVFPKSMEIEFIDGKKASGGGDPGAMFANKVDYIDKQLSKLVLGQTATTDAIAGGHAVGKTHNEVRQDIKDADTVLLAATLNRDVARPMIMLNRGQRPAYPRFKIGNPDPVDVEQLTKAATALVPLGVRVSSKRMVELTGLPEAQPGEEVLVAQTAKAATGPSEAQDEDVSAAMARLPLRRPLSGPNGHFRAASSSSTAIVARDEIDDTVDEALSDWLPIMTPVIAPVQDLVDGAGSIEEIRDRLASVIGEMDVGAFAELLAKANFGARVSGLVGEE